MDSGCEDQTENRVELSREEMDKERNICSSLTRLHAQTAASSNYRFNVLLSNKQAYTYSSSHGQVLFKARMESPSQSKDRLFELSISKSANLVKEILQGLPETEIRLQGEPSSVDGMSSSVKSLALGLLRECMKSDGVSLEAQTSDRLLAETTPRDSAGLSFARSGTESVPVPPKVRIHFPTLICDSAGHTLLLPLLKQSKTKRKGCEQLCLQRFKKLVENRAACAVMAFLATKDSFLEKLTCIFLKNLYDLTSKDSAASLLTHLIPKMKNESHLSEILSFLRARLGNQQVTDKGSAIFFLFIYHDLLRASGPLSDLVAGSLQLFVDSRWGWLTVVLLLCKKQSKAFDAMESVLRSSPMQVFASSHWRVVFFFFLRMSHRQHSRLGKLIDEIVQTVLSSGSCIDAMLSDDLGAWLFVHLWCRSSICWESSEQTLASKLLSIGADSPVEHLAQVLRRAGHIYLSQLRIH